MKSNLKKFVLPLFYAGLNKSDSVEITKGITITTLSEDYEKYLKKIPEIVARRKSYLKFMKCALVIQPSLLENSGKINSDNIKEFMAFIAMSIRLATAISIDIPYLFFVKDRDIKGCETTGIRTYQTENSRYVYPLDDGVQSEGLKGLQNSFNDIAQKYILDSNKNVLIRAIEFAGTAFQARHVHMRLVLNTVFLESLFTCANTELAYQIASSISWYLKSEESDENRVDLFKKIKKLYGYRSDIVHGADISMKSKIINEYLIFSENINTEIFKKILNNKHVDIFSQKQDKRQEIIQLLTLGSQCELLKNASC